MTPTLESRTFELGLVYTTSWDESNQCHCKWKELSNNSKLFIFISQAINALNKQFNLGWKLMNYDFRGDPQTQSSNRMVKIHRTARNYSESIPKCSLTHLQPYRWKQGRISVQKGTKTWYLLKIAPHLWTHGAHMDSWKVWKQSPSLGTVTRKHLTHDWAKILPWEIQELLQGSANERRLFLHINYVFLLQIASIQ